MNKYHIEGHTENSFGQINSNLVIEKESELSEDEIKREIKLDVSSKLKIEPYQVVIDLITTI